LRKGKSVI